MSNRKISQKNRIHRLAGGKAGSLSGADRSNVWLTPPWLVKRIRKVLGGRILLDPCTEAWNPVRAVRFYTVADDGLAKPWRARRIFVNPPYSDLEPWVSRALAAAAAGSRVIVLAPARIDAPHHQMLLRGCIDYLLLAGRIRFLDENGQRRTSPPFGSIIYGLGVSVRPLADLGCVSVTTAFGTF